MLKTSTKIIINDEEIYQQSLFSETKESVIKLTNIKKIINIESNHIFLDFKIFDKCGKEIILDNYSISLADKSELLTELLIRKDLNTEYETQQSQHFAHQPIKFRRKKK